MLPSEIGQLFREKPSISSDVVALSATESLERQPCSTFMSFLIPVFLEFRAAVLEADLLNRNVSSQVELPHNPVPSTHHGYSNAVAVLVDAENVLGFPRSWSFLLKQSEEAVATGHQDARDNPTMGHVVLESSVGSILAYGQAKPLMVGSDAEDRVASTRPLEAEQASVQAYRWMVYAVAYPAPLPSVPLSFLNQLARDVGEPVSGVDKVVELRVCSRVGGSDGFKSVGGDSMECGVRARKLVNLAFRQWQNVELQCLLRRYLPWRRDVAPATSIGELG
jgi:hypothetical protein